MIPGTRELAYQALTDRIESALSSVSLPGMARKTWKVTRAFRNFDDLSLPQPACVVVATSQEPIRAGPGNLHTWELDAHAIVQFQNLSNTTVDDTLINTIVDAIDGSLNAQPNEPDSTGEIHTTLGGVVIRASIEGKLVIDHGVPGTIETQTFVIIPIAMLVAG